MVSDLCLGVKDWPSLIWYAPTQEILFGSLNLLSSHSITFFTQLCIFQIFPKRPLLNPQYLPANIDLPYDIETIMQPTNNSSRSSERLDTRDTDATANLIVQHNPNASHYISISTLYSTPTSITRE